MIGDFKSTAAALQVLAQLEQVSTKAAAIKSALKEEVEESSGLKFFSEKVSSVRRHLV